MNQDHFYNIKVTENKAFTEEPPGQKKKIREEDLSLHNFEVEQKNNDSMFTKKGIHVHSPELHGLHAFVICTR